MMALASYNQKRKHSRAKLPPVINSVDFIGEVKEGDGLYYFRSIGCSSTLGGLPIFFFGSTVAYKAPPVSPFWKIPSSTASIGSFSNPLLTHYPSTAKEGKHKHRVRQFVPFTIEEKQHNLWGQGDSDCMLDRYYLCICSPVIEIPDKPGVGVVWFTKRKVNDCIPTNDTCHGVGIAEVELKQVDAANGEFGEKISVPVATRHGDVIFDSSSPQWGSVATLLHGEYIYLYGAYDKKAHRHRRFLYNEAGHNIIGSTENQVFLCRVPYANQAYLFPERYTYWDGGSFVAAPSPADGAHQARGLILGPVIYNIKCATLFHTKLFSCTGEGLFVLIGCDKSGNGKVLFKTAENPWGPWRGEGWLIDLKTGDMWNGGDRSSVYVHLWASDLDKGDIVLTWAEPLHGGIEMARIKFEMVDDEEEEQTACSDNSMLSDVERRLFQATHGRPVCESEAVCDSELVADDWERLEARRKTLAKLSGHLDDDHQGQPPLEHLDYSSLFGCNSFSNDYLSHNLFRRNARFEGIHNCESTEYKNCGRSEEARRLGGEEMERLTHLLHGTWNLEGEIEGTVRYAGDTWPEKEEDEEEDSLEDSPDSQFPEAWNCEIHLSPTSRYITYPLRSLRVMNPSPEDHSPQSNDADDKGQTGGKRIVQELETPTAVHNISSSLAHSDAPSTPLRTIWIPTISQVFQVPQKQGQKQESGQCPEHQQEYWRPQNNGTGSLITGLDEETGMGVLTGGERRGYEGGGYVTKIYDRDLSAPISPQSSTESLYRALEGIENQPKYREFGTQAPTNSMKKWLFGKALKRGIQKMIGMKGAMIEESVSKQRRFKKKFNQMNLRRAGKSLVNLHSMRRAEKSEVNLRRFSEEQFPSMA